jgi:diguanylate cyclase (GGDEF)-like protein
MERRMQEQMRSGSPTFPDSSLDLQRVLDAGLDGLIAVLHGDGGFIGLGDGHSLEVACRRGVSDDCTAAIAAMPGNEGAVWRALREREPVVVDDASLSPLVPRPLVREGVATLVALPLKTEGVVLGVLVVLTHRPATRSADELHAAQALADELAVAMERALLFRRQVHRLDRQRLLLEAAETVNRSLDSLSLETTILAEARRLVRAQGSALLVVRGDTLVAQEVYGFSDRFKQLFVVPLEGSPFGRAVLTGETVAVGDVGLDDVSAVETALAGEYRALLAAPLQSYRGTYGTLAVFYDAPQHFGEDEKTVLRTFAIQAAIALDNRRLMREKDQMAVRDGLTGAYNRSYLELTLERTKKELRRNGGVVSVIFLDLDDMKKVNDNEGHQAGDRLLRELATLIWQACRETDVVARYGGDEFVVLMPGTDAEGARQVALKLEEAMARHNAAAPGALRISVSMGVHTADSADLDDLLLEADRRMYAMKRRRADSGEQSPR